MEDVIVKVQGLRTLDKISSTKHGGKIQPKIFGQEKKDPNGHGEYVDDYNDGPFPGTVRFITPTFDDIKNRWNWGGSVEELGELITKMSLRYPKKHPKQGQLIEPGSVEHRLTDLADPVFTHKEFYKGYYLRSGKTTFNMSDPKQRFMFLATKSARTVVDQTDNDGKVSRHRKAGAGIQLSTVGRQQKKAADSIDREVTAIQYLANMKNDEEKLHRICGILRVPGYSRRTTDASGMYNILYDSVVRNDQINSRFGVTWQKKFIELCEADQEHLGYAYTVAEALRTGVIRPRAGYYTYQGERIDAANQKELENYFKNPTNQEVYIELDERVMAKV